MDAACLLACSGPGAAQAIAASQSYAETLVNVSGGIAIFSTIVSWLRPRARLGPVIVVAMLVVHPGLWMSATKGDCGDQLREFSMIWTIAIAVCTAIWIARSLHVGRPRRYY